MKKKWICKRIIEEMQKKNISEKDLVRTLGLPEFIVKAYLQGITLPPLYDLELIAFKLGLSLNELLGVKKDEDMRCQYILLARIKRTITGILGILLLLLLIFI